MAALFRIGPARWRSRQLAAALSRPPTNHFAWGGVHSSTRSHGRIQSRARACSAQNPSRSRAAASYSPCEALAPAANAGSGGKRRCSLRSVSSWWARSESSWLVMGASALIDRHERPLVVPDVDLARPGDLLVFVEQHLLPLGQPSGHPPEREEHGEVVRGVPHRLVDESRVEI